MTASTSTDVDLFNPDYKFDLNYIEKPYDILTHMQEDLGIVNFCYAFELRTIPSDCKIFNIGMSTGFDSRLYRKMLYIPGFANLPKTTNGKDMADKVIPAVKDMYNNIYVHKSDVVAHVWNTTDMERTKVNISPTVEAEKKLMQDFITAYGRLPVGNIQNPCKRNVCGIDIETWNNLFDEAA